MIRRAALIFSCAALIAGCQQHATPAYYGPTATLDQLVAQINANNSQIRTLWARQDFHGSIVDQKHQAHSVSAHGVLLYRAPDELRIVANDDFDQPLFELGATAENYWLKVIPGMDTLWWGKMANAQMGCAGSIPARPDLILQVLAVGTIDPDFNRAPRPVMHFDNDADAYVVDSIDPDLDRMLLRKQVWYDRQTLHPTKVRLYDDSGRLSLKAELGDFELLPIPGTPKDKWPQLATRYDLFFADSGSTMQFLLRQQVLDRNGIPRAGSIKMPDLGKAGVGNVIQVDKDCE